MSHVRARLAVALVTATAALAFSATASAADVVIPFTNWKVAGTLSLAKLRQSITLPAGSTFNGSADITTGRLSGHVSIPEFTSTIRVLGIPTQVTTELVEAQPVDGTVAVGATGVTVHASTSAVLYLRRLRLGLISIPTSCRTASPVVLGLDYSGPLTTIAFAGTTTVPRLTGCGILGPTLSGLLSGPGNGYHLTLTAPTP